MKGKKTGGRKKGTANRKTQELASALEAMGIDLPTELGRCINQGSTKEEMLQAADGKVIERLSLKERTHVFLELLQYVYPKRKAIEHDGGIDLTIDGPVVVLPSNGREN